MFCFYFLRVVFVIAGILKLFKFILYVFYFAVYFLYSLLGLLVSIAFRCISLIFQFAVSRFCSMWFVVQSPCEVIQWCPRRDNSPNSALGGCASTVICFVADTVRQAAGLDDRRARGWRPLATPRGDSRHLVWRS